MKFTEENDKITITSDGSDVKQVEIEELRREKARNDQLEARLNAIMEQLGMTEE
jgi:hypothetical protein